MHRRQVICSGVAACLFVVGALLLSAGLVVELAVFPNLMKNGIKDGKVLGLNNDGTLNQFTQQWAFPAYISTMQYWTFDYKNPIGILNRAIFPDVIEKGPYAYTETLINAGIKFTADGEQMNFTQATQFNFNKDLSCPTCDPYKDTVTIPDISFTVAMDFIDGVLENLFSSVLLNNICKAINKTNTCHEIATVIEKELGTVFDLFETGPFVTVTVDELLFSGYRSPVVDKVVNRIVDLVNTAIGTPYLNSTPPLYVALNTENGTTGFQYTVLTGKTDYQKSGYILSFTNITADAGASTGDTLPTDWWPNANKGNCTGANGNYALKIDGTNADFFKSYIEKTESLPIYIEDVCRTASLVYDREVTVKGIDGYRFVLPSSAFDYALPDNCGFCNNLTYGFYDKNAGQMCLPSGLLDISNCQQGSPIVISKPHFYQAEKIVTQFIPRFKPTYDNDETTLDIEPLTGTVLSAMKRLQINMLVNQYPRIGAYSVLRPGAYPLVWLNESFLMDDGTKSDLMSSLFTPKKIIGIVCWSAVGVGGFLMALAVLLVFIAFCVGKREDKKE